MVEFLPWIVIGVLIILGMIAAAVWVWRGEKKREPDYYGFFIMGIVWAIIGIPLGNYPLFALGMVFVVTGLSNRSKWKKPKPWKKLKPDERRSKMIFSGIIIMLLVMVLALFLMIE